MPQPLPLFTPATPEAVPLLVTPSTPFEVPEVPVLVPSIAGVLAELMTLALPVTLTVVPLCVTMESVTLALPPFEEKRGTKPDLQPVAEVQTISFACSTGGGTPAAGRLVEVELPAAGATMNAEAGLPPRVSASSAFIA